MTAVDFLADLPESIARAAHYGTSFVPERRGDQERQGYAETLAADFSALAELCNTDEKLATLATEFARYREGYRRKAIAQLVARSRCMSSMITGPSNFPTARNQKRNATERRRSDELTEFRARALTAIRRELRPELRPIMSGDQDAAGRLTAKIQQAEALQERMKEANATIRKHKSAGAEAQNAALVALGFSARQARELLTPDFCQRIGFPGFELTNNNANIRRMKQRLAEVTRLHATPDKTTKGAAARVEECASENRVRLYFPGKPDLATRTTMKANGFRWTPSLECWQAYCNYRSIALARTIAQVEAAAPVAKCDYCGEMIGDDRAGNADVNCCSRECLDEITEGQVAAEADVRESGLMTTYTPYEE